MTLRVYLDFLLKAQIEDNDANGDCKTTYEVDMTVNYEILAFGESLTVIDEAAEPWELEDLFGDSYPFCADQALSIFDSGDAVGNGGASSGDSDLADVAADVAAAAAGDEDGDDSESESEGSSGSDDDEGLDAASVSGIVVAFVVVVALAIIGFILHSKHRDSKQLGKSAETEAVIAEAVVAESNDIEKASSPKSYARLSKEMEALASPPASPRVAPLPLKA